MRPRRCQVPAIPLLTIQVLPAALTSILSLFLSLCAVFLQSFSVEPIVTTTSIMSTRKRKQEAEQEEELQALPEGSDEESEEE